MTETITGEREAVLAELDAFLASLPPGVTVTISVKITGEGHLAVGRLGMSGEAHVTPAEPAEDDDSWLDTPEWQDKLRRSEEELKAGHGRDGMTGEKLVARFNANL